MVKVKWILCSDRLPKKNGDYLTIRKLDLENGDYVLCDPTTFSYVVGEDGGWNCSVNLVTGEVENESRVDDRYAWADCIDDLKNDLRKEIEKK